MIQVMNALMESHAFAKYGIWYSEWAWSESCRDRTGAQWRKKKSGIWISERPFKSTQKDFQYSSHTLVTKQ